MGKKRERGAMRWVRDGEMLAMQWKDNKPVTMLTDIHS